jgi:hypothetical protein
MKDRRTHKLRNGEAGTTLEQDGSSEYLSQTGQVSHYRPGTIAYAATPPLITIIHTVTGPAPEAVQTATKRWYLPLAIYPKTSPKRSK